MCRICLERIVPEDSFQSIFSIYEGSDELITFADMIMSISSKVQITINDGLTDEICTSCSTKAIKFHKFNLRLDQNEMMLKSQKKSQNGNVIKENDEELADCVIKEESICCSCDDFEKNFFIKDCKREICSICSEKVLELHKFKLFIEQNEQILRSKLQNNFDIKLNSLTNYLINIEDNDNLNRVIKEEHLNENNLCEEQIVHIKKITESKVRNLNQDEYNFSEEQETITIVDIKYTPTNKENSIEDDKKIECEHCKKIFKDNSILEVHLKTHIDQKAYKCDHCNKTFKNRSHVNQHMLLHSNEKPHECECCNRKFRHRFHLTQHMLIHTGDKPFKCEYCNKKYARIEYLKKHTFMHTGEKHFKCTHCDKMFSQNTILQRHLLIHTGEKQFECEHCSKKFAFKSHLTQHMLVHTGEKLFVCDQCGKKYGQRRNLDQHLIKHSGEKPYECEHCNKKFGQKSLLKLHLLVHLGERPFKCERCSKTFTQRKILNRHLSIHTGEKPHKCEPCKKTFRQLGHLKRHLLTHSFKKIL